MDTETTTMLQAIRSGDSTKIGSLFDLYRDRLWRMISVRLDKRLSRRISAEDVLQEAFLDVRQRFAEYLDKPTVPVYVWLRFLTLQRLQMMHRQHLQTEKRSVLQEVRNDFSFASSDSLAGHFVSQMTSPSQAMIRQEVQQQLRDALEEMDPIDREVLALRHFEELSNQEVALILEISADAASKRHLRALKRLREILIAE